MTTWLWRCYEGFVESYKLVTVSTRLPTVSCLNVQYQLFTHFHYKVLSCNVVWRLCAGPSITLCVGMESAGTDRLFPHPIA
jgi:hypothetical protein